MATRNKHGDKPTWKPNIQVEYKTRALVKGTGKRSRSLACGMLQTDYSTLIARGTYARPRTKGSAWNVAPLARVETTYKPVAPMRVPARHVGRVIPVSLMQEHQDKQARERKQAMEKTRLRIEGKSGRIKE